MSTPGRRESDVVIVGGGVAGAAAAARLAREGIGVTVLEREVAYTDRVRGKGLVHWGLEAAAKMGLRDVILDTPGASVITRLVTYEDTRTIEQAREQARDLGHILPGIPGLVGRGVIQSCAKRWSAPPRLPAPRCCEAFSARAYALTTPRVLLTGGAVDDGGAWDRAETTIGVVGPDHLYVVPRQRAIRLYVGRLVDHPERFNGPDRERRFLEAFCVDALPHADALADARVLGPCGTFTMTDSWTPRPFTEGVILLGDAAGWTARGWPWRCATRK